MSGPWKSIETKHALERDAFFDGLGRLSRRSFLKVAGLSAGLAAAKGLAAPHGFQPVEVGGFRFAYLSDTHLCQRKLTDRFVRAMLRAVDDLNALSPQPDFVLFGGDLAQLGGREELELGAAMLRSIKAPVKMVAGEHDWFLDLGERWRELFGPPTYSFDHKGVHFVTLMSVNQRDFWTARGLTPRERMRTVATLDSPLQSRFEVGREGREWLRQDLEGVDRKTPLVVFSHSPLYRYYRDWNFWTEDAEEVQALLRPFAQVTVLHGHTHQLLSHAIDHLRFHGMLSTAWPWPYAPQGLPPLTVQASRRAPSSPSQGCGTGCVDVALESASIEKLYRLWDRNPVTVCGSSVRSREV